jgi:enoyl-CoA hydratase/carnithine racemase
MGGHAGEDGRTGVMSMQAVAAAPAREVLYDVTDRVATVTLNRPDRLNAWTATMQDELREALLTADAADNVRAIVLTGAGRGFCAGADMAELSAHAGGRELPTAANDAPADGIAANFTRHHGYMLALGKPMIAAINGPAAGVGFVITLFSDIRYMAEGAKLTTAFARRGLIAEHGCAWLLPRLVGPMNALDLLLSARMVDAREAEAMGFVRVLPAEGFAAAVQARSAEIANVTSPRSLRIIKRQIYEGLLQSLAEATAVADLEFARCRDTEDFREGVAHFVEKRKPNFTGR